MDQDNQNQFSAAPQNSAEFGSVRKDSALFGNVPHGAEGFGTIPKASEAVRTFPQAPERKENHTLTVREVARLFEAAGVARTERSIVNWCQPNRQGISRLDSYFDPNERKYYITPQSAETAIAEEQGRAASKTQQPPEPSERFRSVPKEDEGQRRALAPDLDSEGERLKEMEKENLDLKITNRGKDFFIEQLQKERNGIFDQLLQSNRKVGELETKLLQIQPPRQ